MAKKISTPAAFLKGLKHLSTEQLLASQDQSALHHLWRAWFVTQRSSGLAQGGFILPTVTLLLLMVSLIIGLLISRTYSRTAQVAGDRQQTALYNAATPAIDRGKAKLEYMFREAGLSALPSDDDLERELLKARYNLPSQSNAGAEERVDIDGNGTLDNAWIYETDVDGDGTIETVAYSIMSNASRRIDTNDDGVADTTVEIENSDPLKASSRVVRNGPINLETSNKCPNTQGTPASGWESTTDSSQLRKALQVHAIVLDDADATNSVFATLEMQQDRQAELGNKWGAWFRYDIVASPFARFNFNGAMHTEGSIALVPFDNTRPGNFLYLVSSPSSCIYNLAASEVSVGSRNLDDDGFDFQGQVLQVDYRNDSEITNGLSVDRFVARPNNLTSLTTDASITGPTIDRILLSADTDSGNTRKDSVIDSTKFSDVALNPIVLFTQGISEALGSDPTNATRRTTSTEWDEEVSARSVGNGEYGRIFSSDSPLPFLDDTYRADNRGGPKPVYNNQFSIPSTVTLGSTLTDSTLTENDPLAKSPPDEMGYGLDGYWERRARRAGVRFIVGQRLELGNANEWLYEDINGNNTLDTQLPSAADNPGGSDEDLDKDGIFDIDLASDGIDNDGDGEIDEDTISEDADSDGEFDRNEDTNNNRILDIDSLYPPADHATAYAGTNMETRAHEMKQWKTLRDNLAAAQATAVYHYKSGSYDYPVACLATTVHPGTQTTDRNSRTFKAVDTDSTAGVDKIHTDFLTGNGTNGIEFEPPFAGNAATFASEFDDSNSALRVALSNLAYFAGDPSGAFPPTQDPSTGQVHPYPNLIMWGNFSELRRVIESGTSYANLSPADKTTLHTATCTLGMLAYNVDLSQKIAEKEAASITPAELQALIDAQAADLKAQADAEISQQIQDAINSNTTITSGNWQNITQRFEELLDGDVGTGKTAGPGGLAWTGSSCPNYSAANSEINVEASPCVSLISWANSKGYTPPTAGNHQSVFTFLQNYGGLFYEQFTPAQWYSADIPGQNSLEELVSALKGLFDESTTTLTLSTLTASVTLEDVYSPLRDRVYGFVDEAVASGSKGSYDYKYTPDSLPLLGGGGDGTKYLNSYNWDSDTGVIDVAGIDGIDSNGDGTIDTADGDPDILAGSGTTYDGNVGNGETAVGQFQTGCNPGVFAGLPNSVTDAGRIGVLGVALVACKDLENEAFEETLDVTVNFVGTVKYPALFYLFPMATRSHNGNFSSSTVESAFEAKGYSAAKAKAQGSTYNPYVVDSNIYTPGTTPTGINATITYRPVEDALGNSNGVVDGTENMGSFVDYLDVIPVTPPTTATNWATPVQETTQTDTSQFVSDRHLIHIDTDGDDVVDSGEVMKTGIIDMGLFNGRERMSVRTLSIDLDLLRRTRLNNASGGCTYTDPEPVAGVSPDASDNNGLCWLPLPTLLEPSNAGATHTTGLIYAFREDAVREDAIARPTRADASGLTCDADDTLGTKDDEEWAQEWNTYAKTVSDGADSDQKIEILESNGSGFDPFDLVLDAVGLTDYFDPPVDPCTKISPKPVDFYNDPDRRPHGFVLRNGQDLRRSNTAGTTFDTDYRGMSFVSDNPVYIWGDLNYHSTNGTFANRIEEFSTLLIDSWSNFYSRSTLNTNFATGANDTWRQTEIIADAVTVLSKDFIPGFIIEGLLWSTDPNTTPNSATSSSSTPNSYGGMGIPRTIANPTTNTIADLSNSEQADALGADSDSTADTVIANCATETPASTKRLGRQCWLLENGTQVGTTALASVTSPIALNRNGFPLYQASGTTYAYGSSTARSTEHFEEIGAVAGSGDVYRLTRSRIPRVSSTDNMINAVVISGISPSRVSQQNGGIVNFLRFNESWDTDPADGGTKKILRFAGSLYQLNFSSYAGAFDQITWEPGEVNANDNGEFYYKSPTLNYGYDPALLYVPAGPVARRFTTPGRTRSEFYRELAVDDPYILNLRCAYKSGGITRVDPNVNTSLCSN